MPFDGNGNFTPSSPDYPAVAGGTITAAKRNAIDLDFANGLSNCVTRDGQSPPTANLPMGSFKLTGLAAGSTAGDSLRYEQLFPTGVSTAIAARAWVNFNGTGAVAIRGSSNVSSITDNGVGDYTVNFTTAMPDANYAAFILAGSGGVAAQANITNDMGKTTTSFRFSITDTAGAGIDRANVQVVIFR